MNQLLDFFLRFRVFFTFTILEVIALLLVVNNNNYQSVAFLSSSNQITGSVYAVRNNVSDYFYLQQKNQDLEEENALLRQQLAKAARDSSNQILQAVEPAKDSTINWFIPAKVINNSIHQTNNFITLNKGLKHGVTPGMGVVGPNGIVGQVKACSDNFSTAFSVLHSNISISSQLKKNKTLCTTQWEPNDYTKAKVVYLARHVPVEIGDTITTSGYNAVFPEGLLIGTVIQNNTKDADIFQTVSIQLTTDFSQLEYVYLVGNENAEEQMAIEEKNVTGR